MTITDTQAEDPLDFARKLGTLLDVPLITCKPNENGKPEFYYPKGKRLERSTMRNSEQTVKWRPGYAILGLMGGRVAVIDVDTKNGANVEQVRGLLNDLGVRIFAEVETPSGGRHFYVAGHPDLTSPTNSLEGWQGIDIQSYGCLAFLPGTQRLKYSGAGYRIIFDNLDELAEQGDPEGAQALADWVAEHKRGEDFEPSQPWDGEPPNPRQQAYLDAMLERTTRELAEMGTSSGRNYAAYEAGLKIGSYVAGAGMDEDSAVTAVFDACTQNGLVFEDGEDSVLASIYSGVGNGKKKPRAVPDQESAPNDFKLGTGFPGDLPKELSPNGSGDPELNGHKKTSEDAVWTRAVDLKPYLDGTIKKPEPNVGGSRDDGIQLLYPKRWHTCIGLTTSAKTTFALWQTKSVLGMGGHVLYLHFEEPEPGGVLERLRGMGVSDDVLTERFHWADCSKKWEFGELEAFIKSLGGEPVLAVLDGINAACSQHGWKVSETEAIGAYRAMFVTPLVKAGAAVLSLGHPPKAKDRQNEMHGFGSTGWLDEVDGIGFRMVSSKRMPIGIGLKGFSNLYIVKDRYSEVKKHGELDTTKDQPWYYMGALVVDDLPNRPIPTEIRLNAREDTVDETRTRPKEAWLADAIETALRNRAGRFENKRELQAFLVADSVKYTAGHLPIALELLVLEGRLVWPEVSGQKPRPGWLNI